MRDSFGLTKELSASRQKILASICLSLAILSGLYAWYAGEPDIVVSSLVVGLPIGLTGLSLCCGHARHGAGVFSAFTLAVIGTVLLAASLAGLYAGEPKSSLATFLAIACFALAKKRKRKHME